MPCTRSSVYQVDSDCSTIIVSYLIIIILVYFQLLIMNFIVQKSARSDDNKHDGQRSDSNNVYPRLTLCMATKHCHSGPDTTVLHCTKNAVMGDNILPGYHQNNTNPKLQTYLCVL